MFVTLDITSGKFYQCSIWGFCRGISMFFTICLSKENVKAIKFLGILKKCVCKNKIYFCLKKKSNVLLLTYYRVYCLSFPWQQGLGSATCLDSLIVFLQWLQSWAKEVDNHSLSRSLLVFLNYFFLLAAPRLTTVYFEI